MDHNALSALAVVVDAQCHDSVERLQKAVDICADISLEQEFLSAGLRFIHYWRCRDRYRRSPEGRHYMCTSSLRRWGMDPRVWISRIELDYQWIMNALTRRGYRCELYQMAHYCHRRGRAAGFHVHVTWGQERLAAYQYCPESLIWTQEEFVESHLPSGPLEESREYRTITIKRARYDTDTGDEEDE